MKTWKIFKLNNSNEFCAFIDAQTEKQALQKYRKMLLSSGQYWIEKTLNHYELLSSYGACFVAI